jgi:hypothetical protein
VDQIEETIEEDIRSIWEYGIWNMDGIWGEWIE